MEQKSYFGMRYLVFRCQIQGMGLRSHSTCEKSLDSSRCKTGKVWPLWKFVHVPIAGSVRLRSRWTPSVRLFGLAVPSDWPLQPHRVCRWTTFCAEEKQACDWYLRFLMWWNAEPLGRSWEELVTSIQMKLQPLQTTRWLQPLTAWHSFTISTWCHTCGTTHWFKGPDPRIWMPGQTPGSPKEQVVWYQILQWDSYHFIS